MKKEEITELFNKFENACYVYQEIECWSARELMEILGYTKWQNFEKIIDKAIQSLENAGETALDHFTDVSNMVQIGSGGVRALSDIALTRYACYVVAQNGDPNKPEIAFAQTYFAVQTRKQEFIEQRLLDVPRVNARVKLTKSCCYDIPTFRLVMTHNHCADLQSVRWFPRHGLQIRDREGVTYCLNMEPS